MKKKLIINFLVVFILIIAIGFGIFFYVKLNKLQVNSLDKQGKDKSAQLLKEKNNLISKVGELYLFPEGEVPTIATVSDPALLKDQSFFTTSLKGDKVLIFANEGKAVLFRPSINKIIDIVSIQSNSNNNNVVQKK